MCRTCRKSNYFQTLFFFLQNPTKTYLLPQGLQRGKQPSESRIFNVQRHHDVEADREQRLAVRVPEQPGRADCAQPVGRVYLRRAEGFPSVAVLGHGRRAESISAHENTCEICR